MKLRQTTLFDIKKLILRLFPGLAGYQMIRYARVEKVYEEAGTDTRLRPKMAVDIQFLKHNLKIDRKYKPFKRIRLGGISEIIQAPPKVKSYVLVSFPYWLCNTATVLGIIYTGHQVSPEADCVQIRDCKKTKISALEELILGAGEDQAVLGTKLIEDLNTIMDQIELLGTNGDDGMDVPNLATVVQNFTTIRNNLNSKILSNIKIGKNINSA